MVIILVVVVLILTWEIGERVLFMGRWLVWRLVVCIMMILGIYRVFLLIIMCRIERVMLVEFFVMSIGIANVLNGVLHHKSVCSL